MGKPLPQDMLALKLVGFLLIAGAAAQSVKSCGKPGDVLSNATFSVSPDPIQKGSPLTITVSGNLGAAVTAGTLNVDLSIKALGIIEEPIKKTIPFTLAPGLLAGATKAVIGPFPPPTVPGSLEVSGTVTGTDSS